MHLGRYNWLPIFYFKQFKKLVNIYFIVITLLAFVPGSPKHPALSAMTLCILMLFQAMKDANEVFKIQRTQELVGTNICSKYSYGQLGFVKTDWSTIKVGDIVTVFNNQELPADLLLLRCPAESALVDTTNIDGEMVVKEKYPFEPYYNPEKL